MMKEPQMEKSRWANPARHIQRGVQPNITWQHARKLADHFGHADCAHSIGDDITSALACELHDSLKTMRNQGLQKMHGKTEGGREVDLNSVHSTPAPRREC